MSKKFKKVLGLALSLVVAFSSLTVVSTAAAAPAKVKNLAVTTVDDDEINLKWSKVSGATGYQVYVRNGNSGSWKRAEVTSGNYAEVENLKGAHLYTIKVRAYVKKNGEVTYGSFSSAVKAVTAPDEPKNVSLTSTSETKAKLKWSAVSGAEGYRVYKYNATSKKWEKLKTLTATSYTVAVSKNGGDKFRVKAYVKLDGKAYFSEASDTVVSGVNAISYAKAKSIALKAAGVGESEIFGYEAEYKKAGSVYVYEIEFETSKYEYEYKINAVTGKVISKDVEKR